MGILLIQLTMHCGTSEVYLDNSKESSLIRIDTSELSSNSRMPAIPGSKPSTVLEAITGADILITPLTIPCSTEKLVRLHIKAGALLVQRKSGADLVMSIGERLNTALARMKSVGARQWQCILLSTGYYAPKFDNKNSLWVGVLKSDAKQGKPYIWWKDVPRSYLALQTSLRHFAYRGGVYIPLSCDDEIPPWCKRTEEELLAFHNGEMSVIKQVWPSAKSFPPDPPHPNDLLQEPVLVKDARVIIAQIDGIGPVTANRIWNIIIEDKKRDFPRGPEYMWEPDFLTMLTYLTCDTTQWLVPLKIPGYGKKRREKTREILGIPDGVNVGLDMVDEEAFDRWAVRQSEARES